MEKHIKYAKRGELYVIAYYSSLLSIKLDISGQNYQIRYTFGALLITLLYRICGKN